MIRVITLESTCELKIPPQIKYLPCRKQAFVYLHFVIAVCVNELDPEDVWAWRELLVTGKEKLPVLILPGFSL